MDCLTDTSILVRLTNTADVHHAVAMQAVIALHRQGVTLCTCPQNYVEYRNCATRPVSANGLGLLPGVVETQTATFEATFPLLPEIPDIYPTWKNLAQISGVIGKQVHDARLVATCQVYGIQYLLSFNVTHFVRFAGYVPGLVIVDPANV